MSLHRNGSALTFTAQDHESFVDAFYDVSRDRDNKVVILTGAGGDFDPQPMTARQAKSLSVVTEPFDVGPTRELNCGNNTKPQSRSLTSEAIHAARIRDAFNDLGITIPVVPNPVMNTSTRNDWIIKV